MWYLRAMMRSVLRWLWVLAGLCGCVTTSPTPGATLLAGLQEYQGEMQGLAGPARWPDRQLAAGNLKTVVLATVGGSREFFRLVDLDLRKREFAIAMRETNLRAERLREMKEEIARMEEEIAALKPIVRAQLAAMALQGDGQQPIENIATRGLLDLALDGFSAEGARGVEAPSTKIDRYVVTDLGSFATVRAPDGQAFRCTVVATPESGGWMKCEPVR